MSTATAVMARLASLSAGFEGSVRIPANIGMCTAPNSSSVSLPADGGEAI